ncbi:MAG: hypothetical protein HY782_11870 [Chloroflexi bacterium]|nr:hypothetical protein [Chloroflexota bacterium]
MFQPRQPNSPFGQFQYVVADPDDTQGIANRYDFAENPCQTGADDDCGEWLRARLTEVYND